MCAHPLLQEHQNHNYLLSNHWQEDTGAHQKKITHVQRQKKLQQDGRRDANMIISNLIPIEKVTHNLEYSNTNKVLPLLWSFWASCHASQPEDPAKGLEISRESDLEGLWVWLQDFHRMGGSRNSTLGCCTLQDPGKRSSDPTGDWAKTTCQCWRVSCGGVCWQWLARRMGYWQQLVLEGTPWH